MLRPKKTAWDPSSSSYDKSTTGPVCSFLLDWNVELLKLLLLLSEEELGFNCGGNVFFVAIKKSSNPFTNVFTSGIFVTAGLFV